MRLVRARPTVCATTLAVVLSGPPAEATFPGRDGRIAASGAFGCESRTRIVTMRRDGSDRQRLTPCRRSLPDWSADGARMLLFSPLGLSVMAADGSGLAAVPLAPEPRIETTVKPSVAPGGVNLAYTRLESGRLNVWRAGLDGGGDRRLGRGTQPRWSPRGGLIAIAGQLGGLSLIRARDGSLVRRLDGARVAALDWAPGGRRLAYVRSTVSAVDLYVIRVDGMQRKRLTHTPRVGEGDVVWSPSGERIAFVQDRRPNEETLQPSIWTMTSAGRRLRRIFNGPAEHLSEADALSISWQPRPG